MKLLPPSSLRTRVWLLSLALLAGAAVPSLFFLEARLRRSVVEQGLNELQQKTEIAARMLAEHKIQNEGDLRGFAESFTRASSLRLTLVRPDGAVAADATAGSSWNQTHENHGDRPEISQAKKIGVARSERYSDTQKAALFYVALALPQRSEKTFMANGVWILRLSEPTEYLSNAIAHLHRTLIVAAGVAFVATFLISVFASRTAARLLRRLLPPNQSSGRISLFSWPRDPAELAIAELNQTLRLLESERDRAQAILNSISESVLAVDEHGVVSLANGAAHLLLSGDEKIEGREVTSLACGSILSELCQKSRSENNASREFDFIKNGSHRLLAKATPLRQSSGVVLVLHDVTDLRRLETIRQDFVANVSHELRTPVSVIRANTETLLDGALEDPAAARVFLEALHRNAERLSRLVADLLDLSKLESGHFKLHPEQVECGALMHNVVEALRPSSSAKNLNLEILGEYAYAYADPQALEQIAVNLLDNAIKYTPAQGHIVINVWKEATTVRIEVGDDGAGISEQHQARIFERFYRVDTGRSRDVGGTGLGLAIVRHLAEAMLGHVGVRANQPQGSVFWVELPRAPGQS